MTLDPYPGDAEMLRRKAERDRAAVGLRPTDVMIVRKTASVGPSTAPGAKIVLGPNSPLLPDPAKRATPRAIEHAEQVQFFTWARGTYVNGVLVPSEAAREHPELLRLYAIPNGGARSKKTAGMLKAEGVRKGILDIGLDLPRGPYHGFRLELKPRGRKPTPEQLEEIAALTADGYYAGWCIGWERARDHVLTYLSFPPPPASLCLPPRLP